MCGLPGPQKTIQTQLEYNSAQVQRVEVAQICEFEPLWIMRANLHILGPIKMGLKKDFLAKRVSLFFREAFPCWLLCWRTFAHWMESPLHRIWGHVRAGWSNMQSIGRKWPQVSCWQLPKSQLQALTFSHFGSFLASLLQLWRKRSRTGMPPAPTSAPCVLSQLNDFNRLRMNKKLLSVVMLSQLLPSQHSCGSCKGHVASWLPKVGLHCSRVHSYS